MKKIALYLPVLLCILFLSTGCGNAEETNTTTSDTAVLKDTIDRDSENFSAPH